MNHQTRLILEACKERLLDHYGPRLRGLVLYGSVARGTESAESDLDLMALLEGPFDYFEELDGLVALVGDLQFESEHHISVRPALAEDYEAGSVQIYRNAKSEGILV